MQLATTYPACPRELSIPPQNLFARGIVSFGAPSAANRSPLASADSIQRTDPVPEDTDAALVARLRAGSDGAARALYDRHAERVYRAAYRVLRERDAAEEVVQDAFVKGFDSLGQLRDAGVVGAWLTSIAVRLAYDALRARQRQARRMVDLDAARTSAVGPPGDPLMIDHVREAIAGLSPRLRAVLVMYELEGWAHAEIATALGIPEATSKTRLFQARATLRHALRAYQEPKERA